MGKPDGEDQIGIGNSGGAPVRDGFLTRVGTQVVILMAAVALLSSCLGYGIGARVGSIGVGQGAVHVFWKTCEDDCDFQTGIGAECFSPSFRWGLPEFEKTGLLGPGGWKWQHWYLRIPLWLAIVAFAVPTGVLWLSNGHAVDIRAGMWKDVVGRSPIQIVALVVGLTIAWLASAVLQQLSWPATAYGRIFLRVFVPLVLGCSGSLYLYRWTVRRLRQPPAGRCTRCGYDLTGNVSGRCPECGHTVASPDAGKGRGVAARVAES